MKLRFIVMAVGFSLLIPIGACKKKERPVPQAPVPYGLIQAPPTGTMKPRNETKIVIPDFVQGKWESVKIEILDKSSNKKEAVTIKLNSEYTIPDSNIKIKVGEFLPDFRMDGLTITSVSEEPKNPAVYIMVFEGENQIFKGWLYSKFPSIHPFQHGKYSLILIDGIKAA